MSDVQSKKPKDNDGLKILLIAVIVVGVGASLYAIGKAVFKPSQATSALEFRKCGLANLEVPGEAKPRNPRFPDLNQGTSLPVAPAPDIAFEGPDGKPVKISDFKGQVTVVNFWATWCAPCKEEMPTLGKLAAAYATQPLKVVVISTVLSSSPGTTDL